MNNCQASLPNFAFTKGDFANTGLFPLTAARTGWGLGARRPSGNKKTGRDVRPGRKSNRFTRYHPAFQAGSRRLAQSLQQGPAGNAATRLCLIRRSTLQPFSKGTRGSVYTTRRLPAHTTHRLSEKRSRRFLPVIVFKILLQVYYTHFALSRETRKFCVYKIFEKFQK